MRSRLENEWKPWRVMSYVKSRLPRRRAYMTAPRVETSREGLQSCTWPRLTYSKHRVHQPIIYTSVLKTGRRHICAYHPIFTMDTAPIPFRILHPFFLPLRASVIRTEDHCNYKINYHDFQLFSAPTRFERLRFRQVQFLNLFAQELVTFFASSDIIMTPLFWYAQWNWRCRSLANSSFYDFWQTVMPRHRPTPESEPEPAPCNNHEIYIHSSSYVS